MSILVDQNNKVVVQGITGKIGSFHAAEMAKYGTNIVAGVVPGKGGSEQDGVPVFNTMKEAVAATGADTSILFVPPPFAADSIKESADAGLKLCVAITDGIPAQDMMNVKRYMRRYRSENRRHPGPGYDEGEALYAALPSGEPYAPHRPELCGDHLTRQGSAGYHA